MIAYRTKGKRLVVSDSSASDGLRFRIVSMDYRWHVGELRFCDPWSAREHAKRNGLKVIRKRFRP